MDQLRDIEAENLFQETVKAQLRADADSDDEQKQRRRPGPQKKENPRSEKINCRLTKEEKAKGLRYCKKHGTTEAKLLRASYLAAITQTPGERVERMLDTFMEPLDDVNLHPEQKSKLRSKTKEVLKRSTTVLLLILLGAGSMAPIVVKGVFNPQEPGKKLVFHRNVKCYQIPGRYDCIVTGPQWWSPLPDP